MKLLRSSFPVIVLTIFTGRALKRHSKVFPRTLQENLGNQGARALEHLRHSAPETLRTWAPWAPPPWAPEHLRTLTHLSTWDTPHSKGSCGLKHTEQGGTWAHKHSKTRRALRRSETPAIKAFEALYSVDPSQTKGGSFSSHIMDSCRI